MALGTGATTTDLRIFHGYVFVLERDPKSPWLFTLKVSICLSVRGAHLQRGFHHRSFWTFIVLWDVEVMVGCGGDNHQGDEGQKRPPGRVNGRAARGNDARAMRERVLTRAPCASWNLECARTGPGRPGCM